MTNHQVLREELETNINIILDTILSGSTPAKREVVREEANKYIEEGLAKIAVYEQDLANGKDQFANDLLNDDPLAFVIRGQLHIEEALEESLNYLRIKFSKRDTFSIKIGKLDNSRKYPEDEIPLLRAVGALRNKPAHRLSEGRSISRTRARALYETASDRTKLRLHRVAGTNPLTLPPDLLVKLCLNTAYEQLSGFNFNHDWSLRISNLMINAIENP